ncbi:MAG: competence/damage-inducible protein A [Flavobacteriales bacterium]
MKAQIITIGDEILIGQIIDTNSAWLATELNSLGVAIDSILSVSDTKEAIHGALNSVPASVSLVLMTGGLGPTKDDITKSSLAEWFDCGWRMEGEVLQRVKAHFALRGIPMPKVNEGQAMVPEKCEALLNLMGTAPGMWFEQEGKVYVSMPGVPYEMKHIFEEQVVPRIRKKLKLQNIVHRTVLTQGIGESALMELISEWEDNLKADEIKLAYLPSPGSVRLRLSSVSDNGTNKVDIIERKISELLPKITEHAFGFESDSLEIVIGRLLKKFGFKLAVAESCTGGYISHLVTSVPGSSAYYMGSAVTYSYEAKTRVLGVNQADLEQVGAVSETVAIQMAEGVRDLYKTDFAISSTGIAGPDGGTPEKPVGTVWIGVAGPLGSYALKYIMGDKRERNIRKTALQALQLLRKEIVKTVKISEIESLYLKE